MIKRIASFALAALCLFGTAGCNSKSKNNTEVKKGRYVEEEVRCAAVIGSINEFYMSDGVIKFFDPATCNLQSYNEERNTYTTAPLPTFEDNLWILNVVCSENGEYFIIVNDEGNHSNRYFISQPGQDAEEINIDTEGLLDFVYSPDGRLFAYDYNSRLYETDLSSGKTTVLYDTAMEFNEYFVLDLVGNYLILASSTEINFFDYKNGTAIEAPQAITDFWSENITDSVFDFCSGEEGTLYIACENGLYRYVWGGNLVEQLIDGTMCRMSSPSYHISSVICETPESFLIGYREGVIMRYTYDPEAINEITSTLKVYSLEKSETLSQAISEYRALNPTVRVEYEVGMRKGMTYDDAMKNLTTEILSDNAPDVIMLDGLDIESYVDKKMLVDLSESESIWNPDNELLDNVAKQHYGGGLYAVSCRFRLPVVIGYQKDIDHINSFADIADIVNEYYKSGDYDYVITGNYTADMLLYHAMSIMGDDLFNGKSVNIEKLKEMLSTCAEIYSVETPIFAEKGIIMETISSSDGNLIWNSDDRRTQTIIHGVDIVLGYNKIVFGSSNGFVHNLNVITSLEKNDKDLSYRFGLNEDSTAYTPSVILGICSASDNKEEAEKLIAAALSENVQSSEFYEGITVNTKVIDKYCSANKSAYGQYEDGFGMNNVFGEYYQLYTEFPSDSKAEEIKNKFNSLDTPIMIDAVTRSIITDVGTQCLEGSITPEEAVKEITERLELRMKE